MLAVGLSKSGRTWGYNIFSLLHIFRAEGASQDKAHRIWKLIEAHLGSSNKALVSCWVAREQTSLPILSTNGNKADDARPVPDM